MKIKRMPILLVIMLIIYSCSGNDMEENFDKITFNLQVEEHFTKAVNTFGPIDLTALKNSADGFAVCTNGLGSEMNNTVVKYTGGKWTYTNNFYWPIRSTQNVSFAAYAPAGTNNVTLTSSNLTASNFIPASTPGSQIDLIYAAPNNFSRATSGTNGVSLNFNHILTQVIFSVTTTLPSFLNPKIASLTLNIPSNSGTFNGTSWSVSGSSGSYTLFNGNGLSSTPVTSTPLFMLPQTLAANTTAKINITILNTINRSKTIDLSTLNSVTAWQMGYKVTYNITVSNLTRSNCKDPDIRITAETSEGFR